MIYLVVSQTVIVSTSEGHSPENERVKGIQRQRITYLRRSSLELLLVNPREPDVAYALRDLNPRQDPNQSKDVSRMRKTSEHTAARYHFADSFRSFLHPFPFARQNASSC